MKEAPRQQVFLLWHVHTFEDGSTDELLIGVFRSEQQAKAVLESLREKRGFAEQPEAFSVALYELDKVYWPDGYFADPLATKPPKSRKLVN